MRFSAGEVLRRGTTHWHTRFGPTSCEIQAHPASPPLQPWFCCSWCGWNAGRRSAIPSSSWLTPRTTSGTISWSTMKREVERKTRWEEPTGRGERAAVQSVLPKSQKAHYFHRSTCKGWSSPLLMPRQLYWLPQCCTDIDESQLRSRVSPGHVPVQAGRCHMDFATP